MEIPHHVIENEYCSDFGHHFINIYKQQITKPKYIHCGGPFHLVCQLIDKQLLLRKVGSGFYIWNLKDDSFLYQCSLNEEFDHIIQLSNNRVAVFTTKLICRDHVHILNINSRMTYSIYCSCDRYEPSFVKCDCECSAIIELPNNEIEIKWDKFSYNTEPRPGLHMVDKIPGGWGIRNKNQVYLLEDWHDFKQIIRTHLLESTNLCTDVFLLIAQYLFPICY
jgi:hypothetical protein